MKYGQIKDSGFDTMDELLPMVHDLSHIDFGSIPTHGLARPNIRFWASWVEKTNFFVFDATTLRFSHKISLCM